MPSGTTRHYSARPMSPWQRRVPQGQTIKAFLNEETRAKDHNLSLKMMSVRIWNMNLENPGPNRQLNTSIPQNLKVVLSGGKRFP